MLIVVALVDTELANLQRWQRDQWVEQRVLIREVCEELQESFSARLMRMQDMD
jgi:hypothetical protein